MKVSVIAKNVKVLTKESTKTQDGNSTYYKIGIMSGSELGNMSCSKDVFDIVETDKSYDISATYNSEYKSFKFEKIDRMITENKPVTK